MADEGKPSQNPNDKKRKAAQVPKSTRPASKPAGAPSKQTPPAKGAQKRPVVKPAATSPTPPIDEGNPFGGSASPAMARRVQRSSINVPLVIGGIVAVLAVVAGIAFYLQRQQPTAPVALGTTYQNLGRNYTFTTPSPQWIKDDARAQRDQVDLAFHQKELDAWLTVKSTMETTPPTLGLLAEWTLDAWRAVTVDLEESEPEKTTIDGISAVRITALNRTDQIGLEAIAFANQGIWYRLELLVPAVNRAAVAEDFAAAVANFKVVGERSMAVPDELVQLAKGKKSFSGTRARYTVTAPGRGWRENPVLQQGGRFADLKLVGPRKDVTFVVSVREEDNLAGVENLFWRRLERESESYERQPEAKEITIDGRTASVHEANARLVDGEYFLQVTFLKTEKLIFQMVGRGPADAAAEYGPIFSEIVASFRLLDENLQREIAAAPQEKPREPAPEPEAKTPHPETPKEATAPTSESEGAASVSLPKAGPINTQRRNLDDLE